MVLSSRSIPMHGQELLESLTAGDHLAFERLVRSQAGHLLAMARRMVRSEYEAS
jgi:hypothetical protein